MFYYESNESAEKSIRYRLYSLQHHIKVSNLRYVIDKKRLKLCTCSSVSELDKNCWVPDCQGCPEVIRGYDSIVKSMQQAGTMLNKQVIV